MEKLGPALSPTRLGSLYFILTRLLVVIHIGSPLPYKVPKFFSHSYLSAKEIACCVAVVATV